MLTAQARVPDLPLTPRRADSRARDVIDARSPTSSASRRHQEIVQRFLQTIREISTATEPAPAAPASCRSGRPRVCRRRRRGAARSSTAESTADDVQGVVTTMVSARSLSTNSRISSGELPWTGPPGHRGYVTRTVTDALATIESAIARMDQLTRAVRESAQSNRHSVEALGEQVLASSAHADVQAKSSRVGPGRPPG